MLRTSPELQSVLDCIESVLCRSFPGSPTKAGQLRRMALERAVLEHDDVTAIEYHNFGLLLVVAGEFYGLGALQSGDCTNALQFLQPSQLSLLESNSFESWGGRERARLLGYQKSEVHIYEPSRVTPSRRARGVSHDKVAPASWLFELASDEAEATIAVPPLSVKRFGQGKKGAAGDDEPG